MVELYKRHIWNDEKTVNIIAEGGCLNANPKVVTIACQFFLSTDLDIYSEDEESSDEEDAKLLIKHHKGSKMTKGKKETMIKVVKKQQRKEKRKNKVRIQTDFMPIDLLNDPQMFCEKLFSKLRKSTDLYIVKLFMMRLISRLIGRHRLVLLSYYPHILRYLISGNKEYGPEIMAMVVESCHDQVPPDDMKPIVTAVMTHYVTDYSETKLIVVGLNSFREMLVRMPYLLEESEIEYLLGFKRHKNQSVGVAAKSLLNYFKDVCPQLLPRKMRGRDTKIEDEADRKENVLQFGAQKVFTDIDGLNLLRETEGKEYDPTKQLLSNADLKKIRFLQLRKAALKVDRKGFALDKRQKRGDDEEGEEGEEEVEKKVEEYSADDEEGEEEREQRKVQDSSDEEGDDDEEEEDDDEEEVDEDSSVLSEEDILLSLLKKKKAEKPVQTKKKETVKKEKEEH